MRIQWNRAGFGQLVQHPAVQRDIVRRAQAVAKAAGEGYIVLEPSQHPRRDRAAVLTGTGEARRENAKTMALVKALGAGR